MALRQVSLRGQSQVAALNYARVAPSLAVITAHMHHYSPIMSLNNRAYGTTKKEDDDTNYENERQMEKGKENEDGDYEIQSGDDYYEGVETPDRSSLLGYSTAEGVGLDEDDEQVEAISDNLRYDRPVTGRDGNVTRPSAFAVPLSFYSVDPTNGRGVIGHEIAPDVDDYPEDEEEDVFRIVYMGRHTNVTRGGRVFSFSAMVVSGDGAGTAGFGYGRGETLPIAVQNAERACRESQVSIHRFQDNLLAESVRVQFKRTIVKLFAHPPSYGPPKPASNLMMDILEMYGIANTSGRFIGNNNRKHMVRALFKAIRSVEHPDLLARRRGVKMYNPDAVWKRGDPSPAIDKSALIRTMGNF